MAENCMREGTGLHVGEERTADQFSPQERAQERGRSNTSYGGWRRNENFFSIPSCSNLCYGNHHYIEGYGYVVHFNGTYNRYQNNGIYCNGTYFYEDMYHKKNNIRLQIEFYFSEENLIRDFYLRQCMDAGGFVNLSLIASFPCIQRLTWDLNLIRAAILESSKLELLELPGGILLVRSSYEPEKWPVRTTLNVGNAGIRNTHMIQAGVPDINVMEASATYQIPHPFNVMRLPNPTIPVYFNQFS